MTGLIAVCSAVGAWAGEANYQPYVVGERAAGMGGAVALETAYRSLKD